MSRSKWKTWALREKQVTVTTWRFRLLVAGILFAAAWLSYPAPLVFIGNSMLHTETLQPAEAILLENFDDDYSAFVTARQLIQEGYAPRALVPVPLPDGSEELGSVQTGFIEVMIRSSGLEPYDKLPVHHIEPVSLNVARQVLRYLEEHAIRSVIVVSPGFRSTRSYLVYDKVFTPSGIRMQCIAAPSGRLPGNWWRTWHGVQDTALEIGKLLYYRLWVLPLKA